ncbi:hypothetical protein [Nioella nitratireducens]|uniref:hypothetical protein n=1 Tax=Nioella nitratireducens TaxID=1287720 RepID=UPI0008FD0F2D|nr:hypothetical protein [Nioella nitratireducens]
MKTIALTTAFALALTAPAFAQDTLAQGLDVTSNAYTTAELIQLREAVQNGDQQRIAFLQQGANPVTPGAGQALAASLGVNASNYSLPQLIELRTALEANDTNRVNFLLNGGSEVISTQGRSSTYETARAILADGDL